MKILFITLEQSGRQILKSILDDNFFKNNKNQIFTFGMDNDYLDFNDLTICLLDCSRVMNKIFIL